MSSIASIAIGLLLAVTAALLAKESKGLLIGERADDTLCRSLRRIAEGSSAIRQVDDVFTVHLAPDQIVGALRVQLAPEVRAADVERAIAALVDEARRAHPELVRLFVTPLPGDASTRHYARLIDDKRHALLMDQPQDAETPPAPEQASEAERKALGYNAVARLAGADTSRFVAVAEHLRGRGLAAAEATAS